MTEHFSSGSKVKVMVILAAAFSVFYNIEWIAYHHYSKVIVPKVIVVRELSTSSLAVHAEIICKR